MGVKLWLAAGAALIAILFAADLAAGIGTADEAWWLHISRRLNSGEAPYSDFFLGVLPLPLYLTSAATAVLGLEIWVVKLFIDICIVVTALLAARIASSLGVVPLGAGLVGAASLAFVLVPTVTPYSPLSYLLLLSTLGLALAWRRAGEREAPGRRTDLFLVAAGAAAGASVAGKHTVGAAALTALMAAVLVCSPRPWAARPRLRDAAVAVAAAAAIVLLVMAPVAINGDLADFREQALDKGEYVESSLISYPDGIRRVIDLSSATDDPWVLRFLGVYLLPVIALGLFAAAAARRPTPALAMVGLFGAAAAVALPRAAYNTRSRFVRW